MKKVTFLMSAFIMIAATAWAQQQTGIINGVLQKSAEDKVVKMQELIGFDDSTAKRLSELEFKFLLDVQKAENCWLCNKKKRIEKLQSQRELNLQKILPRDEYIKYHSTENNLLNENNRIWLQ